MSDCEKPCPFCGSTTLKSGGDDKVIGTWCLDCEATGPNQYGRYEWNDRAARIRELEAKLDDLGAIKEKAHRQGYEQGKAAGDAFGAAIREHVERLEAKLAKAVEALAVLHHAVCGETGFAECVRIDSGKAYPWPALDIADEIARKIIAELKGETDG